MREKVRGEGERERESCTSATAGRQTGGLPEAGGRPERRPVATQQAGGGGRGAAAARFPLGGALGRFLSAGASEEETQAAASANGPLL